MLFKPSQKWQTLDHLTVKLCDHTLAREGETVFLGVILDEHLSWKSHIAYLASKVSRSLGVISKSSFCLYKSALHTLYFSLVHPYLQYCISVWGSTYPTYLKRLVLLQKRAMRIVVSVLLSPILIFSPFCIQHCSHSEYKVYFTLQCKSANIHDH